MPVPATGIFNILIILLTTLFAAAFTVKNTVTVFVSHTAFILLI